MQVFRSSFLRTFNLQSLMFLAGQGVAFVLAMVGCKFVADGSGDLARSLGVLFFFLGLASYVAFHFASVTTYPEKRPR